RPISNAVLACLLFATPLVFTAALWQHFSSATIASLDGTANHGWVSVDIGSAAVVLAWVPVLIVTATFLLTLTMVLSIVFL
ncbi:hypothetical protein GQ43DRAFT_490476, partial [Delitschia confertaspora ATCC 74209]